MSPTLWDRSTGREIKWRRAELAAKGFPPGLVDGEFGPATLAAVKAFQRAWGPGGRRDRRSRVFGTGRRLSDSGVDFIGRFEGFRGTLYNDPAEFGGGITPSASRRAAPGRRSHGRVRDHVHVELTQQQLDSMVRFTFNVGAGAFRRPSLLQQLNSSGRYHWTAPITDRLVPSAGTPGIGCLGDGRLGRWD